MFLLCKQARASDMWF